MGDHDDHARLGPGVIYKDLPVRRGSHLWDLEEDPRCIFEWQDAELEKLMSVVAKTPEPPTGHSLSNDVLILSKAL